MPTLLSKVKELQALERDIVVGEEKLKKLKAQKAGELSQLQGLIMAGETTGSPDLDKAILRGELNIPTVCPGSNEQPRKTVRVRTGWAYDHIMGLCSECPHIFTTNKDGTVIRHRFHGCFTMADPDGFAIQEVFSPHCIRKGKAQDPTTVILEEIVTPALAQPAS